MFTLSPENQSILNTLIAMAEKGELIGSFNDIPIEVYHHPRCPGVSSSQLKTVLKRSFSHWKTGHNIDAGVARFGNLFHQFASEPHKIRSNENKPAEMILANTMYEKMMNQPIVRSLMMGAEHEISYFSIDAETGILKKARVDGINEGIVFDFKSTRDASLYSFIGDCKKFDYRLSAAYYLEVVSEVTGIAHTDFRWIACEKEAPNECAIYKLNPSCLEPASNDIRAALNKIKLAVDTGPARWEGYSQNVIEVIL